MKKTSSISRWQSILEFWLRSVFLIITDNNIIGMTPCHLVDDRLSPFQNTETYMTQYDWAKIESEYTNGKALSAISRDHGCNRAAIRNHVSAGGWQRPDPADKYKSDILSKATHADLIKFNPVYKKCYDNMAKGQNYYHQAQSKIKKLNHQIQTLNKQVRILKKNLHTEKEYSFPWIKTIMIAYKKIDFSHS